jgi:hypothetical protein
MPISFNLKRGLRQQVRQFGRYGEQERGQFRSVMGLSGTDTSFLHGAETDTDPEDPQEGNYVIWMSDGTGSGDDGDIMIKITAGGTTKTGTLVDFSTLP